MGCRGAVYTKGYTCIGGLRSSWVKRYQSSSIWLSSFLWVSILLYFCLDVLVLFSHISKEIICLTMDSSISNISLCYRFCIIFYLILLSPAICISAARLIVDLPNKVKKIRFQQILPFAIISIIGFFGLGSITILITLMCMYLLYNT